VRTTHPTRGVKFGVTLSDIFRDPGSYVRTLDAQPPISIGILVNDITHLRLLILIRHLMFYLLI